MALTVVATAGFVMSLGVTQRTGATLPKESTDVSGHVDAFVLGFEPLGDGNSNPKPNVPVNH